MSVPGAMASLSMAVRNRSQLRRVRSLTRAPRPVGVFPHRPAPGQNMTIKRSTDGGLHWPECSAGSRPHSRPPGDVTLSSRVLFACFRSVFCYWFVVLKSRCTWRHPQTPRRYALPSGSATLAGRFPQRPAAPCVCALGPVLAGPTRSWCTRARRPTPALWTWVTAGLWATGGSWQRCCSAGWASQLAPPNPNVTQQLPQASSD